MSRLIIKQLLIIRFNDGLRNKVLSQDLLILYGWVLKHIFQFDFICLIFLEHDKNFKSF